MGSAGGDTLGLDPICSKDEALETLRSPLKKIVSVRFLLLRYDKHHGQSNLERKGLSQLTVPYKGLATGESHGSNSNRART